MAKKLTYGINTVTGRIYINGADLPKSALTNFSVSSEVKRVTLTIELDLADWNYIQENTDTTLHCRQPAEEGSGSKEKGQPEAPAPKEKDGPKESVHDRISKLLEGVDTKWLKYWGVPMAEPVPTKVAAIGSAIGRAL